MPRLFTGIEIPPEVGTRLAQLRGGMPGARWIDPENYHLTLRFIGDIDGVTANDIAGMLGRIRREPFGLSLGGLGTFGGNRPHSVWAAVNGDVDPLAALQSENEWLIRQAGRPPEQRKYTPHVTLARTRGTSGAAVADYLGIYGHYARLDFPVDRFVLFSSRDSRGGGPYVVEEEYPLRAA